MMAKLFLFEGFMLARKRVTVMSRRLSLIVKESRERKGKRKMSLERR